MSLFCLTTKKLHIKRTQLFELLICNMYAPEEVEAPLLSEFCVLKLFLQCSRIWCHMPACFSVDVCLP